ncbi:MAG: sigma-54 dependent transcriptional regulator [Deltaproteobacteria bacterium]|nr:sigma-54 dependent transcriptional regulator [Deltaproteobacteria bacterium]
MFEGIVTVSSKMKKICQMIERVAPSDATVLITGESGTGKELIARAIHRLSGRRGAFIGLNCAAIPEDILESELFGYVKGAFTGATTTREGKFQSAHGGTLFLDEIGDMSYRLQAKLLRIIQEKSVQKVGSSTDEKIDVRLVVATNKNLHLEVKNGTFREDLLYRLDVVHVELPPLRDRREDIPVLCRHFFDKFCRKYSRSLKLSPEFVSVLSRYDFRGNVRELQNILERVVLLAEGDMVTVNDLPRHVLETVAAQNVADITLEEMETVDMTPEEQNVNDLFNKITGVWELDGIDLQRLLQDIEKELILRALNKANGNKSLAAQFLNINRTTLIEKLKRLCKEAA